VHAIEQVVHFDTDLDRAPQSWVRGTNTFLPDSIVVRWAHAVAPDLDGQDFHARFSARSRTYHYVLYNHANPSALLAGRAGWVFRPLDVERMREAAAPPDRHPRFFQLPRLRLPGEYAGQGDAGAQIERAATSSSSPCAPAPSCITWCATSSAR
jgi:hypothetical protein